MTPAARVAAATEILDAYLAGSPAEKALTNWARRSRFAGSGDRAAVRDHVFSALRNRLSFSALGGAETGRGLMIGMLRADGQDPATIFTGEGHAPDPLTAEESAQARPEMPEHVTLDCPAWLLPRLKAALGGDFAPVMQLLKSRAPVFLRVNTRKASRDEVQTSLSAEGVETCPHPLSDTALEATSNQRRIKNTAAFRDGLVELQDAASQFVADHVPVAGGTRILDYCAGGGGKALAFAARGAGEVIAHDVDFGRMADIPGRAGRAGAGIALAATGDLERHAPFDVVFCDAPCSGSGAWRRSPEAKWALDERRLNELTATQAGILDKAATLVSPDGMLAYATCSLLQEENRDQIDAFLKRAPGWHLQTEERLTPLDGGDGFYLALLTRVAKGQ